MLSGRRSASTAAEQGETLSNCSNSIGKESIVLQSCSTADNSYWLMIPSRCCLCWRNGEHDPAGRLQDQDGSLPEQGDHLQDWRLLHLLDWGYKYEVRYWTNVLVGPVTMVERS